MKELQEIEDIKFNVRQEACVLTDSTNNVILKINQTL